MVKVEQPDSSAALERRLPSPGEWEKVVVSFEDAPSIAIKLAVDGDGAEVAGFEEWNRG